MAGLNIGDLQEGFNNEELIDIQLDKVIMGEDDFLDDVNEHIQENLEDDLVKEALEKGEDLRLYAKKIEDDLKKVENASIKDYIQESDRIAKLHKQIGTCDNVLESMESMLYGFQHALSSISSEIQSLQVIYYVYTLNKI